MVANRIASLLAAGTEILYGLGLADRVVAVSHECDFPDDATQKPRVTWSRVDAQAPGRDIDEQVHRAAADRSALYEIDVPRLASLAPDLIVTQAQCEVCAVSYEDVVRAVQTVEGLKEARIVSLNPRTLNDIFDDILRVSQAAGRADRAARYVTRLRDRVQAVQSRNKTLPIEHRPRVVGIEWIEPVMLAANWMPELIELAGGRGELTWAGQASQNAEWNSVVAFDPQVVVVMPCGFDVPRTVAEARRLAELPGWNTLSAVQNRRVFAVDGNAYFNRSGPRIVDSLEILARLIHPDIFGDPLRATEAVQPLNV